MKQLTAKQQSKRDIYLIGVHVLFGFIATILPVFVDAIVIAAVLLYVFKYSISDSRKIQTLIFISYLTGLEILHRATGASFLPYEISKYVQITFIVFNMFISKTRLNSFVGVFLIILLLPSIILYPAGEYKYWVFNTLGVIALGFLISYTGEQKIEYKDFVKMLKSFLLPCISFVVYITIKTPALSEIEFSLGANFETTGGFGTNQVATMLGAAICLILIMLDKKIYFGSRPITLGLMIYFFLRALLSFSRGGIIGLVLSVVLANLLFKKIKQATFIKAGAMLVLFAAIFIIANNITGGVLLLRYQGETAGTLSGNREKDANVILTGRTKYAGTDIALFLDNPFLGVGPGNSQFLRYKYGLYDEAAPHTEATRLLGENGLFGLCVNIILFLWPIYIVTRKTPDKNMKYVKSILFIFAYASTYHSAIRTGITPLFYGLASMNIYFPNDNNRQIS